MSNTEEMLKEFLARGGEIKKIRPRSGKGKIIHRYDFRPSGHGEMTTRMIKARDRYSSRRK